MIDQVARLNQNYLVKITKDEQWALDKHDGLVEKLVELECSYADKPLPTLLKPHFVSPRQASVMTQVCNGLSGIIEKYIDWVLDNDDILAGLQFRPAEVELFRADHGLERTVSLARLDAFMHEYAMRFIEFNCDSPGGVGYGDALEDGIDTVLDGTTFGQYWQTAPVRRCARLVEAFKRRYIEFCANRGIAPAEAPRIAIVDWRDVPTKPEFGIIGAAFTRAGWDTHIADPRDLRFDGSQLLLDDEPIDVVYRRVVTRELAEAGDDASALRDAILAGTTCVVNPPRAAVAGNKKALALVRRPEFQELLTAEEVRIVKKTIPWTEVLADTKVEFNGFLVQLRDFVLDNRERLVLKPAVGYGGRDVVIGPETSDADWRALIETHMGDDAWVVQQLVRIPQEMFPVVLDGPKRTVEVQLKKVNVNPLVIDGTYAGSISRVSDSSVINVSAGGGMLPTVTVSRRDNLV